MYFCIRNKSRINSIFFFFYEKRALTRKGGRSHPTTPPPPPPRYAPACIPTKIQFSSVLFERAQTKSFENEALPFLKKCENDDRMCDFGDSVKTLWDEKDEDTLG